MKAKPEENETSIAERELERAFPLAVKSLIQLALHSEDEKVRRAASLDLLNLSTRMRELSKVGDDRLLNFMRDVTEQDGNAGNA